MNPDTGAELILLEKDARFYQIFISTNSKYLFITGQYRTTGPKNNYTQYWNYLIQEDGSLKLHWEALDSKLQSNFAMGWFRVDHDGAVYEPMVDLGLAYNTWVLDVNNTGTKVFTFPLPSHYRGDSPMISSLDKKSQFACFGTTHYSPDTCVGIDVSDRNNFTQMFIRNHTELNVTLLFYIGDAKGNYILVERQGDDHHIITLDPLNGKQQRLGTMMKSKITEVWPYSNDKSNGLIGVTFNTTHVNHYYWHCQLGYFGVAWWIFLIIISSLVLLIILVCVCCCCMCKRRDDYKQIR